MTGGADLTPMRICPLIMCEVRLSTISKPAKTMNPDEATALARPRDHPHRTSERGRITTPPAAPG